MEGGEIGTKDGGRGQQVAAVGVEDAERSISGLRMLKVFGSCCFSR